MPTTRNVTRSAKCSCNIGWMVVSWVLMAVGIWALVAGFASQFASGNPTAVNVTTLGWYFGGVVVFSLGKWAKWKGCGACSAHQMK